MDEMRLTADPVDTVLPCPDCLVFIEDTAIEDGRLSMIGKIDRPYFTNAIGSSISKVEQSADGRMVLFLI